MFRHHPNKPEDAIAKLLEKYEYDSGKLESFVDACSTYNLLISPSLSKSLKQDAAELAKHRDRYRTEFELSTDYLKNCPLSEKDVKVLNYSINMLSDVFVDNSNTNQNLG